MKAEIEIPEGKKAVWKDGVLTLADDITPKGDITERVKSFSDAVAELGGDHPDVVLYLKLDKDENELPKDVRAYLMLRIITAALNEGWEPTFEEGGSPIVPARLICETGDHSKYSICKFGRIWRNFMLG